MADDRLGCYKKQFNSWMAEHGRYMCRLLQVCSNQAKDERAAQPQRPWFESPNPTCWIASMYHKIPRVPSLRLQKPPKTIKPNQKIDFRGWLILAYFSWLESPIKKKAFRFRPSERNQWEITSVASLPRRHRAAALHLTSGVYTGAGDAVCPWFMRQGLPHGYHS